MKLMFSIKMANNAEAVNRINRSIEMSIS